MSGTIIWMVIAAFLPAVLLAIFTNRLDKYRQDASIIVDVLKCFGVGVLSALPSVYLEEALLNIGAVSVEHNSILDCFIAAFVGAAIPEEFFKIIAFLCIVKWISSFDEYMQGVVYMTSVGLGFAAIENMVYLFNAGTGWMSLAVVRALMSIPGHFLFALFMGFFLSKVKLNFSIGSMLGLIFVPVITHGLYDFFLFLIRYDESFSLFGLLAVIALMVIMIILAKKAITHLQETDLEEYVISITPPPTIKNTSSQESSSETPVQQ